MWPATGRMSPATEGSWRASEADRWSSGGRAHEPVPQSTLFGTARLGCSWAVTLTIWRDAHHEGSEGPAERALRGRSVLRDNKRPSWGLRARGLRTIGERSRLHFRVRTLTATLQEQGARQALMPVQPSDYGGEDRARGVYLGRVHGALQTLDEVLEAPSGMEYGLRKVFGKAGAHRLKAMLSRASRPPLTA